MAAKTEKTGKGRSRAAMALGSAALIALSSLLSVSPYGTDFKISVGAVALPVLVFLMRRLPVLPTAVLGGAGVFLVRVAAFGLEGASFGAAAASAWPEFVFYCVYGLLLWGYNRIDPLQPFRPWVALPLALIDFAANMVELPLRIGADAFAQRHLWQLVLAAVCRAVMAALAMGLLERYGLLVMRRQDALRYRRLLLMTSTLDSELFWMQKSSAAIEATMAEAYGLYQSLSESEDTRRYAASAMQIATDIHEVKKEYMLITRGIGEALQATTQRDGMAFSEICDILKESLARGEPDVEMTVEVGRDFFTRSHYAVMSMLHNLLSNAVEAAGEGPAVVRLAQRRAGEDFIITVADQSGGIDEAYMEQIFLPGFSSKMDGDTGVVNRGLGLCIVQEMARDKFGGRVEVAAQDGGTTFTLTLPAKALEDEP